MKRKDKAITLTIVIFLVAFAVYRLSTYDRAETKSPKPNKKLQAAIMNETLSTLLNGGEPEFLALLAIKYDVDLDKVKTIIKEFSSHAYAKKLKSLMEASSMEELEKYKKNGIISQTFNKIDELYNLTSVDKKTIAAIIIDYKALNNVGFQQETAVDNYDNYETDHDAGRF